MRQWRVGSFSMALVLILLGVGLLLGLLKGNHTAFNLVATWWPVAVILLGVEILLSGLLQKGDHSPLKYDFLSILVVLVVIFFSLVSYALQGSGVIALVQEAVGAADYTVDLPELQQSLEGIDKIVVDCPDGNLEVRSIAGENKVSLFGRAVIHTVSQEEAASLAALAETSMHASGKILYIQAKNLPGRRAVSRLGTGSVKRTLLVPEGCALELNVAEYHSNLLLSLDSLGAPWTITTGGRITASLSGELDAAVEGVVYRYHTLGGNAPWEISETEGSGYQDAYSTGRFVLGEGTWPMLITAGQDILVNLR